MPGRNDPCPCGSGKKYKKCCLPKEHQGRARRLERMRSTSRALEWLWERYGEEVSEAIRTDYLGHLEPWEQEALWEGPGPIRDMLEANTGEWILAEAELLVGRRKVRAVDLVLGPGGPLLGPAAREWLETIAREPVWLFEVVEAEPGKGLRIRDMLGPEGSTLWVRERKGSEALRPWSVIGVRLVEDDGQYVFSGAIYAFDPQEGYACLGSIRHELGEWPPRDRESGRVIRQAVVERWTHKLLDAVDPQPVQLTDLQTGQPLVFVTDHFRVRDWDALEARLGGRPDVDGDRVEGWTWLEGGPEEHFRRIRAALNPKGGDRLDVFTRTLARADEARAWLEEVAGDVVVHRLRETSDPLSAARQGQATPAARRVEPPPEVLELVLRRYYEDWADVPIPALGGKSPREAVKTPEGREAVEALIKSYEHTESQRAAREGGKPVDFGFLWDKVGLARPGTPGSQREDGP